MTFYVSPMDLFWLVAHLVFLNGNVHHVGTFFFLIDLASSFPALLGTSISGFGKGRGFLGFQVHENNGIASAVKFNPL